MNSSLNTWRRPRGRDFQQNKLHNIVTEARIAGKEATLQKVALYFREIFPVPEQQRTRRPGRTGPEPLNKREARRREYAITQSLWQRDRRRCILNILDQLNTSNQPHRRIMEPYWTKIMTTEGEMSPPTEKAPTKEDIWTPIIEDIKMACIPRT